MNLKKRAPSGYRRYVRHPAQVTSDRLADHLDKWFDSTTGSLRDDISRVRAWLEERAEKSAA